MRVIYLSIGIFFILQLSACRTEQFISEQFTCGDYHYDSYNETMTFCVDILSQINESQEFVAYQDGVVLACPVPTETNSRRCLGQGTTYILHSENWGDIDSQVGNIIVIKTLETSWFDILPRDVTVLDWWELEE